jgi:signal transduction histidine kinase
MPLLPAALPRQLFGRARVERVIAGVRVGIAASSWFAVWLDPAEPARMVDFTYTLHALYFGYAVMVAAVMWRRDNSGRWPIVTHVGDILIASVLQYMTLGPSSPFFTYFVYALFSAALRWGWQATVRTAVFVLAMYVVMGISISRTLGPSEFESDRFIIRTMYLVVLAVTLVYLGQHEAWLRDEIQRLARWPVTGDGDWAHGVPRILEHAAGIAGAGRAVCVWTVDEESPSYEASWPEAARPIIKHPAGSLEPLVASALADRTFLCAGEIGLGASVTISSAGSLSTWSGQAVHPALLPNLAGSGLASAPFRTDQLSGRVFFTGLSTGASEIVPLVEVLSREIGASLEHLHSYERSQQLAVAEERIRVARNLHDGVLQSLSGIRLELQRMARHERRDASPPVGDRLLAIERALSLEQRELRSFIEDLRPTSSPGASDGSLSFQLDTLRRRLSVEWQTPITIRVSPADLRMSGACERDVPLMVHEGIVNALKHGKPTGVSVAVYAAGGLLHITVSDDGRGFPFTGRRSQAALVAENVGPVSLRERVTSLGGDITVESSDAGSRVDLSIPLGAVHA